ncbi:Ubiquitin thioesterase OTUB1 [Coccomyxa sp. Obi]|nr:Ubiquitin thioesterase OTUB1 [Coccomyxa sp. Obi]
MRSAYAGNESPARAESSVGAISHQQNAETFTDGAESRPLQSVGDHSVGVSFADNTLRTSVNSVSAAVGDSADEPTAEIVTSTPILVPNQGEETSRPTDDQIIAQENSIRAAEAEKMPFVGTVEPLSALEEEYRQGSFVFREKIRSLEMQYGSMRRTRGDGNCFFRSFMFAFMEKLVQDNDLTERNRVVTCIRQWKAKLIAVGFQELVFEDAMEIVIDQLNSLGTAEPLSVPQLENNMRDAMLSPMIIMLLRMLTSAEIQRRSDFFAPFIMGMCDDEISVEQFCRRYVEPMGEESDHVHIVALTNALQVPIRVVYLDRSMGAAMAGVGYDSAAVNHHDFVPDALSESASAAAAAVKPRVHVLYRPGHYDILYPLPVTAANSTQIASC